MAILKPKIYYQMMGAAPVTPVTPPPTTPAPYTPPPFIPTAPVVPAVPPTAAQPAAPINIGSAGAMGAFTPTIGAANNEQWAAYQNLQRGRQPVFGALGGLGDMSFPARPDQPQSEVVGTDQEINGLFGGWVDSQKNRMSSLSSMNVDRTAADRAYTNFFRSNTNRGTLPAEINRDAFRSAIGNEGKYVAGGLTYDLSGYLNPSREAVTNGIGAARSAVQSEIGAGQASHQLAMTGRAENQTRQQQAYNSMLANGSSNGLLTSAYSQPGFNQVTGQPAPPSFGSLTAGSGTFDPATQSGVFGAAAPKRNNSWSLW